MNDFQADAESLLLEEAAAAERVIRSGWYVLGKEVGQFERSWATACGAEYAVGVGNGMDAIEIGLRSLNIGPGDEVITTAMTAFATVLAIIRAGATPVLADIDESTALLSLKSVQRCLSKQTKAVLLVHLYGQITEMSLWQQWCDQHNIHLLEDCAQAHLATSNGQCAGTFGKWGAYSFYPTKNLGAVGDAGALVTNDKQIADTSKRLRNYGQSDRYHHLEYGVNSRLDEIQAAILSVRLKWLRTFTERRRQIASQYEKELRNQSIEMLAPPANMHSHVYHLFVLRCHDPKKLIAHLHQHSIAALQHYPVPIHHQRPCLRAKRDPAGLSVSEKHAQQCVSIPCHPHLTEADVSKIIQAVNSYEA